MYTEQVSGSDTQLRAAQMGGKVTKEISRIDYILITTMACTGTAIFIVIVILVKTSKHWNLDGKLLIDRYPRPMCFTL